MAMNWKVLENLEQLEEIKKSSFDKPVLIFKHSTRCSISHMVLEKFQDNYDISAENLDAYFLDLIAKRPISNKIAEEFSIYHQSPQILVIKDGKAVFDTSHMMIDVDKVKAAIA